MEIKLETLSLKRYNELKHRLLKEEFKSGESSSQYIHQVDERLEFSKDNTKTLYQSAFVVEDSEIPIGYVFISNMKFDEVFLEYAVLKDYRKMGYGSKIVNEVSDYLFQNHNIKSIRLDIDPSNQNSILVAGSCGFMLDEDEYESRNFIGKMQFIKESELYISKRSK